ncbi:hypothetical protein BN10_300079 [Phycicoccus elongatus Lp2]|uniref:Uncharacterized protein n=1 Tax=Phycicoccus elongatus Lp2 TaxID=1193181 RepID=N0DYW7_9MICO|nr:hypothetical protein BN10_300079 [Phycicoccus elongatus Lp2]
MNYDKLARDGSAAVSLRYLASGRGRSVVLVLAHFVLGFAPVISGVVGLKAAEDTAQLSTAVREVERIAPVTVGHGSQSSLGVPGCGRAATCSRHGQSVSQLVQCHPLRCSHQR